MEKGSGSIGFRARSFVLAAALLGLTAAARLAAQTPAPLPTTPPAPAGDTVGLIKLRDDSIDQVLELLERWTGRTILRPQALPANTYTLTLDRAASKEEAILALETLLNMNGVAVTPLGGRFLKITSLNLARAEAPEFIDGPVLGLPPSGRVASKLFELQFLRVSEFLPQIAALLNPNLGAAPVLFEKANAALVTDSISNLQRIELLLSRLDQPILRNNTPKFYTLQSAKASDVVNKLRTVLAGPLQMQLGASTSYQADDRTNQIVLISDPRQIDFFDQLISRFDVKADPNTRNDVIFLKHAAAKDVATLLSLLVSGQNTAARTAGTEPVRPATGAAPAPNVPAPPAAALPAGLTLDATHEFSNLLTILPEERSNSLVVSGTVDDIRLIRELVDKIDVLLAQVRIEVVVAEVTLGDSQTSGIDALGLQVYANRLVGLSGSGSGTTVGGTSASGTPTGFAQLAGTGSLAGIISLGTTPRKTTANILSMPNIVTTHNKKATIFVGEQRPVISSYLNTGVTTGGTVGTGYTSTVTEKDIGIDLEVTPLIGDDGSVQLEIKQEVNDVTGSITLDGNEQPIIGRRKTESFVSVKSGEIIVLGGLQRNSLTKNTNRLGPVPIIGDLLGTRRRDNTRTELVFFLRPVVLANTAADNAEAMRRIDAGPQRDDIRSALDPNYRPPAGKSKG
ncbi:secretin N-terminal domain-containing protein [Opitutus sp. GAS368]|uniref:secretin N-terminal domain-containing protein n=1 Tax=Opitutus sp. GAS368 TaxID=1882749 RepID=UPI00087921A2|nr:secretin N-terminal domain-containing protein [Opitutus sp. GAS368]SDS42269.1 type II secretion system protein D (GspD) [Opitutus sp. GAS368]